MNSPCGCGRSLVLPKEQSEGVCTICVGAKDDRKAPNVGIIGLCIRCKCGDFIVSAATVEMPGESGNAARLCVAGADIYAVICRACGFTELRTPRADNILISAKLQTFRLTVGDPGGHPFR
jgi:predicted nucleic-acid-binding Zn-ribbon protein